MIMHYTEDNEHKDKNMSRYLRLRVLEHITIHLCEAHSSNFNPYYVRKNFINLKLLTLTR